MAESTPEGSPESLLPHLGRNPPEQAGFVNPAIHRGSTVVFDAVKNGDIDVYIDYSGTIWATVLKKKTQPASREQAIRESTVYLESEFGMTVVGPLGFENTYALVMRDKQSADLGIRTISELVPFAPTMSMGADYEFFARPEWRSVEKTYRLEFKKLRSMDPALMYQAVAQGTVDVISGYYTDGRIEPLDLRVLVDDKHAIPPYDALIVASRRLTEDHPNVIDALSGLVGTIDAAQMRRMNGDVDEKGESASAVARRFLAGLDAAPAN